MKTKTVAKSFSVLYGLEKRQRLRAVKAGMARASDYDTWRRLALELDALESREAWKANPASPHYQFELIERRLSRLQLWRKAGDWSQIIYSLREGLQRNLGNLANPELYKHAHVGTKRVIDDYINEVTSLLNHICDHDVPELAGAEKFLFFKNTGHSFGRTALLLSGGATLGMFHLGVLKALWEQKLLPRVISGSSAGALLASLVGTRTDSELPRFFSGEEVELDAFHLLSVPDMLRQKSLMDSSHLESFIRRYVGDYTFEEAYRRTKRIINITVSPVDKHHQPRLLNYLTTPHLTVWSAVMASCAVPGLFPPVTLMTKERTGDMRPYMPSVQWADGSLQSDLPMRRLAELYNVNHYLVSQTNPHVLLVMEDQKRKAGWLKTATRLIKGEVQYRSRQALALTTLGLVPGVLKRAVAHFMAVADQPHYGDVTIYPEVRYQHYVQLLSNISQAEVKKRILEGERATWARIAAIRDQTVIGQTLEDCIQRLKRQRRSKPVPEALALEVPPVVPAKERRKSELAKLAVPPVASDATVAA